MTTEAATKAPPYTPEEFMIVTASKLIRDNEASACGAVSPVPAGGLIMANETHAPNATIIVLGSTDYYPFATSTSEFFDFAQRGRLDLFFVSGAQIDGDANYNLHIIGGTYEQPAVRLPGGYGTPMLFHMARRAIMFRTEHSKRVLPEKVDFVTARGVTSPWVHRFGLPAQLVTPMIVADFEINPPAGMPGYSRWRLRSITPGYTLRDVEENTGFRFRLPQGGVPETPAPTPEELRLLRTVVKEKLSKTYPEFCKRSILPVDA